MSFLETPRFPDRISFGSVGGPKFNTTVITIDSGWEQRNANWAYPLSTFDAAYGVQTMDQLYELVKFFRVMQGRANGFRFKDHLDFKSHHDNQKDDAVSDTDQTIGTGDGNTKTFQLIKSYTEGILTKTRIIQKPVVGTTVVSLDDVSQGSGWTVDTTTGIITFTVAPGAGVVVKAGFEFDVPMRFASDSLETNLEFYGGGSTSVMLTEIRV